MKQKITILSAKNLEITHYKGSGPGGQKKNKTSSGVQIFHKESGAMARCSEYRSQEQNKRQAFINLCNTPKMKLWINSKVYEIRQGEKLEKTVERMMVPENLKIEKQVNGKWVPFK